MKTNQIEIGTRVDHPIVGNCVVVDNDSVKFVVRNIWTDKQYILGPESVANLRVNYPHNHERQYGTCQVCGAKTDIDDTICPRCDKD
jgi:hypothetical protein